MFNWRKARRSAGGGLQPLVAAVTLPLAANWSALHLYAECLGPGAEMTGDLLIVAESGQPRLRVLDGDALDALRALHRGHVSASGEAWVFAEMTILPTGQHSAQFGYDGSFDRSAGFLRRRRRWLLRTLGHLDVEAPTPL